MANKGSLRLTYNAPAVLTFSIICTAILILQITTSSMGMNIMRYFTVPGRGGLGFSVELYRLVSHILGHSGPEHLIGNLTYILLLGPILEEKYGSGLLIIMIFITGLVTGIINVFFFTTGLLGASGIVFMMILLTSITNMRRGEIPLTFVLIFIIFVGQEIYNMVADNNNISEVAHIIGGLMGSVFGFFFSSFQKEPPASSNDPTLTDTMIE